MSTTQLTTLSKCLGNDFSRGIINQLNKKYPDPRFINYFIEKLIEVHKDPVALKSIVNQIFDYEFMCE